MTQRRLLSIIAAGLLITAASMASADPMREGDFQTAANGLVLHAAHANLGDDLRGPWSVRLGLLLTQLVMLAGETSPQWGEIERNFDDWTGQLMFGPGLCRARPGNDPVSAIPEPGTFLMLGLGLLGLVAFDRRICRSC